MAKYAESKGRKMHIVNLDPSAGVLQYEDPIADIRDVITCDKYLEIDESSKTYGAGFEHTLSWVSKTYYILKFFPNVMEYS